MNIVKKLGIAAAIIAVIVLAFGLMFPMTTGLPQKPFFEAFPEYNVPLQELEYIKFERKNGRTGFDVLRELKGQEMYEYMEYLSEQLVKCHWAVAIEQFLFGRAYLIDSGSDYKITFGKKDGTSEVLVVSIGKPIYERINHGAYYNGYSTHFIPSSIYE